MNNITKTLILGATLFTSAFAFAKPAPIISEVDYEINNIERLSLNFDHAKISITANESDVILLRMEQQLNKGKAEYCLHQFTKDFTKDHSGDTLALSAEPEKSKLWGNHCSVERKIHIQLGKGSIKDLLLKHAHGTMNFDSGNYKKFTLNASHTTVDISNLRANNANLELHHGNLTIDDLNADHLTLDGSHGNIEIAHATGQQVVGEWRHGSVSIEHSQFNQLEFDSAHSRVELTKHQGQIIAVQGAHSNIRVHASDSEQVAISNRHGPINFKGDAKFVKVDNAHGSINLTQTSLARFEIDGRNSHGNILVKVPAESIYQYSLASDSATFYTKTTKNEEKTKSQIKLIVSHGNGRVKEI